MADTPRERTKVRWRQGWAAIPNAILRDTRVTRGARLFWCVLATYAGNDETAWPSQDELAAACAEGNDVPTTRTIQRWVKALETAGWLTRNRTRFGNEYELHEPAPGDTHVGSDATPMSGAMRHQCQVPCDTHVGSHATPMSDALVNKTHGIRLKEQESSSSAAHGGVDGGAVAPDGDGARYSSGPLVRQPFNTPAYRLLRTRKCFAAKEFAHEDEALIAAYLAGVGPDHPGAQITEDLRAGLHRTVPVPEPALPAAPAAPLPRPDWLPPALWGDLPAKAQEYLRDAVWDGQRIRCATPLVTDLLYRRYATPIRQVVVALGGTL